MKPMPFDYIASSYDSSFTNTPIGQLQRKQVWNYLEKIIPELPGMEILELNCGTGEDAMVFGGKGFNIMATDISEEMLKITQKKAEQFSMQQKVKVKSIDLSNFDETFFDKKFDLVFTNFGGLNCIQPESLIRFFQKVPAILNPGGRLVAVIMPKYCLWESLYFIVKFQFSKALRRWTDKKVNAALNGETVYTWYYNPKSIEKWSEEGLTLVNYRPIGFFLPPSYLEKFFASKIKTLGWLNYFETKVNRFSFLSRFGDHYVIDLKLL